ncbi:hypothetical protein, partial [uncultured Bradyrhizobium sp.]|uniref:hypothetical protein n=1 Tax=uncultured Bradyrhizobium sp. TaxID=199684 RepID=UPI0035CA9AC8
HAASTAGLTDLSIALGKRLLRSGMDCRVKLGHDDEMCESSRVRPGNDGRDVCIRQDQAGQ